MMDLSMKSLCTQVPQSYFENGWGQLVTQSGGAENIFSQ